MTDHIIHLPPHFAYVYQFQDGRSQYRCVASCLSMAAQVAYPGRYQSPVTLMHEIYTHFRGEDSPSNENGMTHDEAMQWLRENKIGAIDMNHLVHDTNKLRAEMEAQNKQNVCQILTIADESKLKYAKVRANALHNWVDKGLSHAILQVGYSDSGSLSYYAEPAAGLAFPRPLPIMWSDILLAGIQTCLAVMPTGVAVPPANFSFQKEQWPAPSLVVNINQAIASLKVMRAANKDATKDAGFVKVLRELGASV